MQGTIATRHSPSFRLIGTHFALGIVGFVAFAFALAWRAAALHGYFFQPHLLGLVHLCVFAWLMPITIGALHQLIPVVFEVPVASERIAWAGLALYVPSAAVFVTQMWRLSIGWPLVVSATGLATSLYLYLGNLLVTTMRSKTRTITGAYVVASFTYLAFAVALGVMLATNLFHPYLRLDHLQMLRAHAHAAALGFFGLLIMGVAYRLLEMFLLAYVKKQGPGWIAFVAINVSLASLIAYYTYFRATQWLVQLAIVSVVVGIAAFLAQVRRIYRARMRRGVDIPWRHTAASFAYLSVAAAIGSVVAPTSLGAGWEQRLQLSYGLLVLAGFIGSVIVGQLHKILPFLVWFHRFSPYVGLKKVPAASELLPLRPQRVQWFTMHGGIAMLVAGTLFDQVALRLAGAAMLAASSVLFARNMWTIYGSKP